MVMTRNSSGPASWTDARRGLDESPNSAGQPDEDSRQTSGNSGLRRRLTLIDASGTTVAWLLALRIAGQGDRAVGPDLARAAGLIAATMLVLSWQGLYRTRICSLRASETERLGRSAVLVGMVAFLIGRADIVTISVGEATLGAASTFLLLHCLRGAFRSYLAAHRRNGRFRRPVVIIGANDEGYDLYRLTTNHPELGFEVVGIIGNASDVAAHDFDAPHIADIGDAEAAVRRVGASGAIVAATAVNSVDLNRMSRSLLAANVHVHLSSGLRGIGHGRLRAQPMVYEPLFYLEPMSLAGWPVRAKRVIDLVLGSVLLVLVLPAGALAALAVKLQDGGPVLYRQTRIGRNGREFTILKLRTMVLDAERAYDALARLQAGRSGPLVKLRNDPRITRVGRVLRAASIDELPQIWNVIRGSMSLVGPRPLQPTEARAMDPDFLAQRSTVRPGVTGLWQVEARDNPSFDVYRRFDLFYLENWSMSLDIAILLATVQRVTGRGMRNMLPEPLRARLGVLATSASLD